MTCKCECKLTNWRGKVVHESNCTTNKPRKHAELIKAWADGATIQFLDTYDGWVDCYSNNPAWNLNRSYRIKPEPKPDVVLYAQVGNVEPRNDFAYLSNAVLHNDLAWANIKLTFDSETNKLKSVELID